MEAYRDFSSMQADKEYNGSRNRRILTLMAAFFGYSQAGREVMGILRKAGKPSGHPALITFVFCELRKYTRQGHQYYGGRAAAEEAFAAWTQSHLDVEVKTIICDRQMIRDASGRVAPW